MQRIKRVWLLLPLIVLGKLAGCNNGEPTGLILSGFAFPIRNMPEWIQYATYLDPLRYYLEVIHGLFLKGGDVAAHPFQYGMMALLGDGALGLSMFRVR